MTQKSAEEIRTWLMEQVAGVVGLSPDEVDIFATFETHGLGSREAVGLSGDIEDWLGVRLAPSLLYQYTTIEALARHLATLEPQARAIAGTGPGEGVEHSEHQGGAPRPDTAAAALPPRPDPV